MSSTVSTFSVGSTVYEPYLGLCTIVDSSEETMLGESLVFFQLQPEHGTTSVKVPARAMASRGIRGLLSSGELEQLLLAPVEAESEGETAREHPSKRVKRWSELVRATSPSGPYNFLREVQDLVATGYRLNAREQEMQEAISRGVVQEIASVLELSAKEAGARFDDAFTVKSGK